MTSEGMQVVGSKSSNGACRSSTIRDLCSKSKELAKTHCLRCGRPLCAGHIHLENERCAFYEAEYKAMIAQDESMLLLSPARTLHAKSINKAIIRISLNLLSAF
jgi:hypothetical protein